MPAHHHAIRALCTTSIVASLVMLPSNVHAAPSTPPSASEIGSMIDVYVGDAIAHASTLSERIREVVVQTLRAHRIELDAQVRTRLTIGVGGESYAFRINAAVFRDGRLVGRTPASWTCACTSEELLVEISQHVVDMLPELNGEAPAQAEVPTASPATPPPVLAPPLERSRRRPLGRTGQLGVGLASGGLVTAVTGVALLGAGRRERRSDGAVEGDLVVRELRPAGYALLGIGAAALVTGAALFAVERRRARTRSIAASPTFGPRMTGISLTTRF